MVKERTNRVSARAEETTDCVRSFHGFDQWRGTFRTQEVTKDRLLYTRYNLSLNSHVEASHEASKHHFVSRASFMKPFSSHQRLDKTEPLTARHGHPQLRFHLLPTSVPMQHDLVKASPRNGQSPCIGPTVDYLDH